MITDRLIWLHIPKTAGDATLAMFEQLSCPMRLIHSHKDPQKHDTLADARKLFADIDELAVIANLRRLPEVALSFFHHMQRHAAAQAFASGKTFGELTFGEYIRFVLEHPDTQSYDWHLDHFLGERDATHWLRVDRLEESFLERVGALHPISAQECEAICDIRKNVGEYEKDLQGWLTRSEMNRLYDNCPRWKAAERGVYGDLLFEALSW